MTPNSLDRLDGDQLEGEADTLAVVKNNLDVIVSLESQQEEVVLVNHQGLSDLTTSLIEDKVTDDSLKHDDHHEFDDNHDDIIEFSDQSEADQEDEAHLDGIYADGGVGNKSAATPPITPPLLLEGPLGSNPSLPSGIDNSGLSLVLSSQSHANNLRLNWPYLFLMNGRMLPNVSTLPSIPNPTQDPQSLTDLTVDRDAEIDIEGMGAGVNTDDETEDHDMGDEELHEVPDIKEQQQTLTSHALIRQPKIINRFNPLILLGLGIAIPSLFIMDRYFNSGNSS